METKKYALFRGGRLAVLWLCAALALSFLMTPAAAAQTSEKDVRVGWFESPFNTTDSAGWRSGYGYEY